MAKNEFKRHRFSQEVILCAVRWYCRYNLSYRDVRDLLSERGIIVDSSSIYRWVQKFGPLISHRSQMRRTWRGLDWHIDETYLKISGKWYYLWRAVDQHGKYVDSRLTARRNYSAAKAFLNQAMRNARAYQPLKIVTDKAHAYRRLICDLNSRHYFENDIIHVDRKWQNNRIESDHASLKQRLRPMRGFKSLTSAKSTLAGIEAFRMIRKDHVQGKEPGPTGEIQFLNALF